MTSKLLWVLVLLIAAVAVVKPLRERVAGHMEPALNPVYEWNTKNRVNDLQRLMAREISVTGKLPRPREFRGFVAQREGDAAALDSWGEPFYLAMARRTYRVGSSGRDRVRGTEDDILSEPAPRPGT